MPLSNEVRTTKPKSMKLEQENSQESKRTDLQGSHV